MLQSSCVVFGCISIDIVVVIVTVFNLAFLYISETCVQHVQVNFAMFKPNFCNRIPKWGPRTTRVQ
jgi:hypothetical protein